MNTQYNLVKSSREVVFNFCESFSPDDYTKEVPGFGKGNIRSTQAHVGSTYIFWLADFGMKRQQKYPAYIEYKNVQELRQLFEKVDMVVSEFLNRFENKLTETISGKISSGDRFVSVTALQLFTHVVTHEFHHKGQVMSMGRILGYTPPDADIIRFT